MKEFDQSEQRSLAGKSRWKLLRVSILAITALVVFTLLAVTTLRWRRQSAPIANDPYASIPFRPAVTYDSSNVSVRNTEQEPYLNTSLVLYVQGTRYSVQIGTIRPGESVSRSLLSLTNERGESFNPHSLHISELEVRANFRGYDVHKDFPPPK